MGRARLDSARPFERANHAVPARHLLAGLHLGQEKPGETSAADYGVEVSFGETGVEPVHPDPDPVAGDLGCVGAHAGACIRLLRKRHGIFEIEDEGVRRQPDRFIQEFFAIGRNVEKAARKRHGGILSERSLPGLPPQVGHPDLLAPHIAELGHARAPRVKLAHEESG